MSECLDSRNLACTSDLVLDMKYMPIKLNKQRWPSSNQGKCGLAVQLPTKQIAIGDLLMVVSYDVIGKPLTHWNLGEHG